MKYKSIFVVATITLILSAVLAATWKLIQPVVISQQSPDAIATDLDALIKSYKAGEVDVIDISTITPFAWERLYLFGPYTTNEQIVEATGIRRLGSLKSMIEYSDGIVLFVFVNQNKIVKHMDYYRTPDFVYSIRESGYSPSEAIFIIDDKDRAIPKSP